MGRDKGECCLQPAVLERPAEVQRITSPQAPAARIEHVVFWGAGGRGDFPEFPPRCLRTSGTRIGTRTAQGSQSPDRPRALHPLLAVPGPRKAEARGTMAQGPWHKVRPPPPAQGTPQPPGHKEPAQGPPAPPGTRSAGPLAQGKRV